MSADELAAGAGPAPGRQERVPYPPGAVTAAWLSLDEAWTADETGVSTRVIAIMALLSGAGMRRELLHAAGQAGALTSGGRRVTAAAVDDALAGLAGRSLLTADPDGRAVVMPPLVAEAARGWLAAREQLPTAAQAAAVALEAHARSLDAARDRPAARDFPDQVTALLAHAGGPSGRVGEGLARDLLRLRFLALYYLIELGDSAPRAVTAGEPLTADLERMLGPDHPDTLNARNSLAAAYLAAGRPAEAVPLFERTLVGRERTLGPNHPDTLTSQNNLAAAYQDVGRIAEAILLLRLTLAARERLLGAGHPDTLSSRGNLAAAYRAAGRAAEAIPLLEQTLSGRERILGTGHPDTQAARDNLDQAQEEANRPPEAFPPAGQPPAAELPPVELPPVELPPVEAVQPVTPSPPADPEPEPPVIAAEEASARETTAAEPATGEPEDDTSREPALSPAPEPGIPRLLPLPAGSDQPAATPRARRRVRLPWVAAAVVVLIAASGVAGAVSRSHADGHATGGGGAGHAPPADAAQLAADWVSQQVSRSVTVACDPLMCAALEARGVPTTRLLVLRTGAANPRGAAVVVATPAVRNQFGSRLDSEYAPSVIAGFGSGPGQVNVQAVAPDGAAAYRAALRQDLAARRSASGQLMLNQQIGVTARARTQLAAGEVDTRLLILLPALAATHPVQVLAFGDSGPGAGAGTPLCTADLSGSGRAAGLTDAGYQRWLISFVRAQFVHFGGTVVVVRPGGQPVVRVEFARPSPIGLLSPG